MSERIPGQPDRKLAPDDDRKGLTENQRFLYATGQTAQMGAQLELSLATLFSALAREQSVEKSIRRYLDNLTMPAAPEDDPNQPATPKTAAPNTARAMIIGCRDHLPEFFQNMEELRAAQKGLDGVARAFTARNRVIHDVWLGETEKPTSITRLRRLRWDEDEENYSVGAKKEPSSLQFFEQTVLNLGRAKFVVGSLTSLTVRKTFPPELESLPREEARDWAFVRGEFTLDGIHAGRLNDSTLNP